MVKAMHQLSVPCRHQKQLPILALNFLQSLDVQERKGECKLQSSPTHVECIYELIQLMNRSCWALRWNVNETIFADSGELIHRTQIHLPFSSKRMPRAYLGDRITKSKSSCYLNIRPISSTWFTLRFRKCNVIIFLQPMNSEINVALQSIHEYPNLMHKHQVWHCLHSTMTKLLKNGIHVHRTCFMYLTYDTILEYEACFNQTIFKHLDKFWWARTAL